MPVEIKRLQAGPKGTAGNSTVGDLVEVANALNDAAVASDEAIRAMQTSQDETGQALTVAQDNISLISSRLGVDYGGVKRVVFIGASIFNSMFGRSLDYPSFTATLAARDIGLDFDIYGLATGGHRITDIVSSVIAAFEKFPNDGSTMFVIHSGGDVTDIRPYSTATTEQIMALNEGYDQLLNLCAQRSGRCHVCSMTFRSYANPASSDLIFNDESLGSKPFNENIVYPKVAELLPETTTADGKPQFNLYDYVRNNYTEILEPDGVHLTESGEGIFRAWILNRLKNVIHSEAEPITPKPEKSKDVYTLNFNPLNPSDNWVSSINNISDRGEPETNYTNGIKRPLKRDGEDFFTAFYEMITPEGLPSGNPGIANANNLGNYAGMPELYAGDLLCRQLVADGISLTSAYTVDHKFTGLYPSSGYTVEFVSSRNSGTSRVTRMEHVGTADAVEVSSSLDPAVKSPSLSIVTDETGSFTLRQSTAGGTLSYINAIQLVKA